MFRSRITPNGWGRRKGNPRCSFHVNRPPDYTDFHKPFLKKKSFTKRTFFLLAQVFFFPKKEKVLC